ncbi:hypothetical protein SPSYN_00910 [Sporotomaculum syntrophicum]|uniref:Uncharacterized protein n=1 Tax=Sporotomaculum syntrophicum TaxID=182264 RepID=A0A9D2WRM0_9FIRM|nr:hypothetical protein [Sporotomaculum syntrophicum]KAF1086169.1 hypothetical protein SPSYN_00910 [Sporotomaculum syntrophicum]
MLRRLLGKVDDGRFGRALAGLQAGWQWQCEVRQEGLVEGFVLHGSKRYMLVIGQRGRRYFARCSCEDAVKRGCSASTSLLRLCLSWGWQRRRAARSCRRWGAKATFFWSHRISSLSYRICDCTYSGCAFYDVPAPVLENALI